MTAGLAPCPASNSTALAAKYASMVPWWSRWSRLRLVNAATSKTMPSTRCWARAWEETSRATAPRPSSRNSASRRWRSGTRGGPLAAKGADQPGPDAGLLENGLDQMDDGGLAVGAGDPHHGQVPGGVAVEGRGHGGHRWSDRSGSHPDLGDIDVEEPFAEQGGRPASDGLGGEGVAIGVSAGHTAEQRAGPTRRLSNSTERTSVASGSPRTSSVSMSWISAVICTMKGSRNSGRWRKRA